MPKGYPNNQQFLELAPDGTSFIFNNEDFRWHKIDGKWYCRGDHNTIPLNQGDEWYWDESSWVINDIDYVSKQNYSIPVATTTNIRDMLEFEINKFATGNVNLDNLSPYEVHRAWLDMLLNVVELSEKGLLWRDYKDE